MNLQKVNDGSRCLFEVVDSLEASRVLELWIIIVSGGFVAKFKVK